MSPVSGLAALCVAFTAGLTLTLVVVDSSAQDGDQAQRIETAAPPAATESSSSTPANPPTEAASRPELLVVAGADQAPLESLSSTDADPLVQGDPTPSTAEGTSQDAEAAPADTAGTDAGEATSTATADAGATTTAASPSSTPPDADAKTPNAPAPAGPSTAKASGPTTAKPAPTTKAPTTAAPTTQAPTTAASAPPKPSNGGSGAQFEPIRNRNPLFNRYENLPASQISVDMLTEPAPVPDNGSNGDGNFRMACAYSHFSYDDPIVFPGQPGKSHLHMFFGNTKVDAHTNTNSLVNSGGSSCNGFELNRSGYWTPALLDGKGNAVVPDQIILYYKTKDPSTVKGMPQGLKMIAGNPTKESFTADYKLGWSCGPSGTSYNRSNRIPNNCGSDPVNAYIQFPFCWDGRNLDSADHSSHMAYVNDNQSCPGSHPVRLPQISILMYFPPGNTNGWYLSSDKSNGFNTGPGATLHADWFGGWHDDAMNLWINGCMTRARNCSYGQTGTNRMFAKLNGHQNYPGNNFLPLP